MPERAKSRPGVGTRPNSLLLGHYDIPTANSWAVQPLGCRHPIQHYVNTDHQDCHLSGHSGAQRAQLTAPTRVWVCQELSWGGYEAKQPAARTAIRRRYDTPTVNSWAVQTTRLPPWNPTLCEDRQVEVPKELGLDCGYVRAIRGWVRGQTACCSDSHPQTL